MKRQKLISALLVASMLMTLSGCDSDNRAVLEVADEYAQAVTSFNCEDIADLMDNGEGIEDEFNTDESKFRNLYKAITGSFTYSIDKNSIASSKKNREARADITFSCVDYEMIYHEVFDEGGDLEAYINALDENNGNSTYDVKVTVDFVFENDKWLVKDDSFKDLHEIYGFMEQIPDYPWVNFKKLSEEEFEEALFTAIKVGNDEYNRNKFTGGLELDYFTGNLWIMYHTYDDNQSAYDEFKDIVDQYNAMQVDTTDYIYYVFTDNEGYLTVNNLDVGKEMVGDYSMYGGYYFKENTVIYAMCYTDYINEHEKIDDFLKNAGLPQPH